MAALRSLSFCLLAVGLLLPAAAYIGQKNWAEAGRVVSMPCSAAGNKPILSVEWSRTSGEKVLLVRNGQLDLGNQHPSFRTRAELQDPQMKGGDVSLVLRDLRAQDTGTYRAQVDQGDFRVTCSFQLEVRPPGESVRAKG
ncbi:myelin-oligodendrocyte glycoprotein-like [Menidia menidia]